MPDERFLDGPGVVVIASEAPQTCELCGTEAETRPYGPNGEEVCFPCGMKDPEAAKRAFNARLDAALGS